MLCDIENSLIYTSERITPTATRSGGNSVIRNRVAQDTNSTPAFRAEHQIYLKLLDNAGETESFGVDPLEFWALHSIELPIHARLAAKILSAPATSADVERLFSLSGRILCKLRSSLTADHVNELTSLNKWLNEEKQERDKIENSKAGKSARVAQKFTTLSLKLELVAGESSDDYDEDDAYELVV